MTATAVEDFEDLYQSAPCGYLSLSRDGLIVQANSTVATWTGFGIEELVGRRFRDLLKIAGRIYYETHLVPLLRMQPSVNEVAFDLVVKEERILPVLLNAAERRNASGDLLFTRITLFDATDRRRYERHLIEARAAADSANEQLRMLNDSLEQRVAEAVSSRLATEASLRQSQKMEAIGHLTGGIAHDFNNLLAGITGSIELLALRLKQGRTDNLSRYIDVAQGATKRAASLTHRLLAFARQQNLEPRAIDVNRLVSDMEELVRRTMGPAVELDVSGAGGVWHTIADPNQLENAILNLCVNARDAMPGGGRLTIETANELLDERSGPERDLSPGEYVSVCVSDTGDGMTPEVIARAFDPFFTTKAAGAGTGLGLAMVYGFARQSDGQVRINSEVGHGTTVCIYLPRYRGSLECTAQAITATPVRRARTDETVFVVDDESSVRMLVTEVLEDAGYRVIEASDGPTALSILKSNVRIDLLITDVGLPGGLDGRQIVNAGRVTRHDMKVLFITGYAPNAVVANGHLEHDAELLTKPFSIDGLLEKVTLMLPKSAGGTPKT